MEVLQADGAVKYLLHYQQHERIIVITESMVIGQFQVSKYFLYLQIITEKMVKCAYFTSFLVNLVELPL